MKMRLSIDIEDISYAGLIALVSEYADWSSIPAPMGLMQSSLSSGTVSAMLELIPKDKQDELVMKIFSGNKDRIINMAERLADKKGLEMKISDISLTECMDEAVTL